MALLNPSENWDDDFEFQAKITMTATSTSTNAPINTTKSYPNDQDTHHNRMSFASSDWDNEDDDKHFQSRKKDENQNKIFEDKKNTLHMSPEWIEPGPSTPKRNQHRHQQQQLTFSHALSTENWDDDFEDSPVRRGLPSPEKEKSSPSRVKPRKQLQQQARPESWDDEFDGLVPPYHSPTQQSKSIPQQPPRSHVNTPQSTPAADYSSSEDEQEGRAESGEFGYIPRDDDDRTVTARSRRAALSRLSNSTISPLDAGNTPPPPVPPLPLPFLLPVSTSSIPTTYVATHRSPSPSPFPRSPTSSVFSVPTTARPPSSAYTVTSTTHLRPTVSRSSSGLGGLPPSPPIHRERERRRLRKKSRPPGVGGGIELSVIRSDRDKEDREAGRDWNDGYGYDYRYNMGGDDDDVEVRLEVDTRPKTPPLPAQVQAQMHSMPSSPSGGASSAAGALLSRIGSVKKWSVRRKRGSTTPSEIVNLEKQDAAQHASHRMQDDANSNVHTPRPARPHSQASISSVPSSSGSSNAHHQYRHHHHAAFTPPVPSTLQYQSSTNETGTGTTAKRISTSNTWFFRSTSSSSNNQVTAKGSTSDLDLTSAASGLTPPQTPVKNKWKGDDQTPAKLVKRKSLGFVQLRRNLGVGGHGDDVGAREKAREKEREKEKERYGGLGLGRAGDKERVVDVFGTGRESEADQVMELNGGREHEGDKDTDDKGKEKERDGSRGFMGSVRRLSLVGVGGRHKRTKSGVSVSNVSPVVARLDVVGVGIGLRDETVTPTPKNVTAAATPPVPSLETPTKANPTSSSQDKPYRLLPPIELQPPSPPRVKPIIRRPSARDDAGDMLSPTSSTTTVASSASAPSPTTSPSAAARKSPLGSPQQAASLGRSTIGISDNVGGGTVGGVGAVGAMRRSSLGDLKIPERISQAQVSLRKDMERVREFAAGVEQLKELQVTYDGLVMEIQAILDSHAHAHAQQQQQQQQPSRATSPSFFANLARPKSRNRSNTNPPAPSTSTTSLAQTLSASSATTPHPSSSPTNSNAVSAYHNPQVAYKQLASAYYTIRSRYRISWECAELLIDLGSGNNTERGPPSTSISAPAVPTVSSTDAVLSRRKSSGRERAITLGGEDPKPSTPVPGQMPPPSTSTPGMSTKSGWRASTGKHDLSQRQLVLLKEILGGGDANTPTRADEGPIPEEVVGGNVNRDWRWGRDPMGSTLTLPSEDSSTAEASEGKDGKSRKKRRASRLGMTGLRDMLRLLKRSQVTGVESTNTPNLAPMSSTSLSTTDNSSMDSHRYPHARVPPTQGRRRAKTSSGPESVRLGRPASPYGPSSSLTSGKPSPRRPSLASIFRLGQKAKPVSPELPPELVEQNHYHQNMSGSRLRHHPPRSRSASGRESSSTGEEEDWDRMDDASGMDAAARVLGISHDGSATVKGKANKLRRSPYLQDAYTPSLPSLPGRPLTPKRSASGSQSSLRIEGSSDGRVGNGNMTPPHPPLPQPARITRLSNVEEHESLCMDQSNGSGPRAPSRGSNYRTSATSPRVVKTGSVRSMPPQPVTSPLPDPAVAMTPDNIRPLLENAREVHGKLVECNTELRALLAGYLHR